MHNVALDSLFRRDFDIERPTYTNLNRWLTEIISCLMSSRCVSGPLNLCMFLKDFNEHICAVSLRTFQAHGCYCVDEPSDSL